MADRNDRTSNRNPGGLPDSPEVWAALGHVIKIERVARGLERKELAEMTGISYPYLSEIETGKKRPSWSALGAIADALTLRASDLLAAAETRAHAAPHAPAHAPAHAPPANMSIAASTPAWLAAGAPQTMRDDLRSAQHDLRSRIEGQILAYLDRMSPEDAERLLAVARAFAENAARRP